MRIGFFTLITVILLCSCNNGNSVPVMIDGIISDSEWINAAIITIDSENEFLIKQDECYYYLAIESLLFKPLYIDLFIKSRDSIFNIHASSQLGDRILKDSSWTDISPETLWGQNEGWIANTVRFDQKKINRLRSENFEGNLFHESYIPYDGFELQFDKNIWHLKNAKIRIEIRSMVGEEDGFKTVVFPLNSQRKKSELWYKLSY